MTNEDIERVVLTEDEIQSKVAELGKRISEDYGDREPLLVGVLKGAFVLMADLSRRITVPVEFDFMAVASYGSSTRTSGVVRIIKDLDLEITDRHVVIVEDIVDSGLTLSYLMKNLRGRRPLSLEVCALMTKPEALRVPIDVRYHGFAIPPAFVVGYGLDWQQRYRNLPYVGTLKPHLYEGDGD
ncbi:MAG: hypoxanthine phosphoribosyltransferase [Acidobacteria bacterium]|nr:hypoxanthine phosphoribosyltransferase [Acidobacteriota bacterium]